MATGSCNKGAEKNKGDGSLVTLPLTSVIRDPLLRSRVGPLDGDHVAGMAESITAGHPPPPPTVYKIAGRGHFLVGGWYTVAAHELAGVAEVAVVEFKGTWAEAVVAAARQNREHDRGGLKRSNADKRHAVTMVLTAHPEWSDRSIAKEVGVEHHMVADRRSAVAKIDPTDGLQVGESPTSTLCFRKGLDGKAYPLPVPDRSRPSSREEHREPIVLSWESFGAQLLPLLKNNIPLPRVYPANQVGLKQISFFLYRLLERYSGPLYCRRVGRMLTDAEKAEDFEGIVTDVFREMYDGSEESATLAEQLEVLRDNRFPAGALP